MAGENANQGVQDGKPAQPTITLTQEEYKDWVNDQVAKKLFRQLAAIVAAVGTIAATALYFLANSQINQIRTDMEIRSTEMEKRTSSQINEQIDKRLPGEVKEKVGGLLIDKPEIQRLVKEVAEPEIKKQAEIKITELAPKITDQLDQQVQPLVKARMDDYLADRALNILQKEMENASPRQKRRALRQMEDFELMNRPKNRLAVFRVIKEAKDPDLLADALEVYLPPSDAPADDKIEQVKIILERLDKDYKDPRRSRSYFTPTLQSAYAQCLGRFENDAIDVLRQRIVDAARKEPLDVRRLTIIGAMARIPTPDALNPLIEVTKDTSTRKWGLDALQRIDSRQVANSQARIKAIQELWNLIGDSKDHLSRATVNSVYGIDPTTGEERYLVNEEVSQQPHLYSHFGPRLSHGDQVWIASPTLAALSNLLNPEDWDKVNEKIWPKTLESRADYDLADLILYAWVHRVSRDNANLLAEELFRKAQTLPQGLRYPGAGRAILYALSHGPVAQIPRFLEMFADFLGDVIDKNPEQEKNIRLVPGVVIQRDEAPFALLAKFLDRLDLKTLKTWGMTQKIVSGLAVPARNGNQPAIDFLTRALDQRLKESIDDSADHETIADLEAIIIGVQEVQSKEWTLATCPKLLVLLDSLSKLDRKPPNTFLAGDHATLYSKVKVALGRFAVAQPEVICPLIRAHLAKLSKAARDEPEEKHSVYVREALIYVLSSSGNGDARVVEWILPEFEHPSDDEHKMLCDQYLMNVVLRTNKYSDPPVKAPGYAAKPNWWLNPDQVKERSKQWQDYWEKIKPQIDQIERNSLKDRPRGVPR